MHERATVFWGCMAALWICVFVYGCAGRTVGEAADVALREGNLKINFFVEGVQPGVYASYDQIGIPIPLRMFIDGERVMEDSVVCNNIHPSTRTFRLSPGLHSVVIEIPFECAKTFPVWIGEERDAKVFVDARFWWNRDRKHSADNHHAHMVIKCANESIPVF